MNTPSILELKPSHRKKAIPSPILNNDGHSKDLWENCLSSKEKWLFFYRLALQTIESYRQQRYTAFDAHTTSNCCHGMAVFVKELIQRVAYSDVNKIESRLKGLYDQLSQNPHFEKSSLGWIPGALIDLIGLYALSFVGVVDPIYGRRTVPHKLKEYGKLGTEFCKKIIKFLQKLFSNLIAESYTIHLTVLNEEMEISGVPLKLWGKYVQGHHKRVDKRRIKYVSSMFSMQVVLAYLIHSCSKVAHVNDLISVSGKVQGRYVQIFEGDGKRYLRPLSSEEILKHSLNDPIVIFGSYAITDSLSLSKLEVQMTPWLYEFPCLVQAHEIHYPQFPAVADDPDFDSSPIIPQESVLKNTIRGLSEVRGVAPQDPSFCCFSHIFSASTTQVLSVLQGSDQGALPFSHQYLPSQLFRPDN